MAFDEDFDHETVELFCDRRTGLIGVVAIDSTTLGPAMGGLRLSRYASVLHAAVDAMRLARTMTLKNAAAGLDLGGGKAVVIDDGRWAEDREARMRAFGDIVDRLGGRYVTAEDVGTTPADMHAIASRTSWVVGRPLEDGGRGDPSPSTALTVLSAIRAAARIQLGAVSLAGVQVGVLGVGHVGAHLVRLLRDAGATVVLADVDEARARGVAADTGSRVAAVEGFATLPLDVLAPCALGGVITAELVDRVQAKAIAGAANNPLAHPSLATNLERAGVLYVPDFLANCGGIIHVAADFLGFGQAKVDELIEQSLGRTSDVLNEAAASGRTALEVAIERADRRLTDAGGAGGVGGARRGAPTRGHGHLVSSR